MMTGAPTPVPVGCGAFVTFHPSFGSVVSHHRGVHGGLPAYMAMPSNTRSGGPNFLGAQHAPFIIRRPEFEVVSRQRCRPAEGNRRGPRAVTPRPARRARPDEALQRQAGRRPRGRVRPILPAGLRSRVVAEGAGRVRYPAARTPRSATATAATIWASGCSSRGGSSRSASRGSRSIAAAGTTTPTSTRLTRARSSSRWTGGLRADHRSRRARPVEITLVLCSANSAARRRSTRRRTRPLAARDVGPDGRRGHPRRPDRRRTDAKGYHASENVYRPEDFAASLYTKMGIDPHQTLHTTTGRPVHLVNGGRLIRELFV